MIEFKKVTKSFGSRTILNQLSFAAEKGEVLFILGTSGTGKSVLLKLIVGLLTPTSGEIYLDSQQISHLSEDELFPIRQRCGMVFQQPALFDSLNVYDNVAFGPRKQRSLNEDEIFERVKQSLSAVDFNEEIFDQSISSLSYGMQKRVSLARTLALHPEVLLFDEPTTGLDPVTTQSVNRLIQQSSKQYNTTSLVVSHDMESALQLADRILVLSEGHIVELASPQEIRRSKVPLVQDFLAEVFEAEGKSI